MRVAVLSGEWAEPNLIGSDDGSFWRLNSGNNSELHGLIRAFNPDFVSIQYSPFGYSRQGVPWSLGKRIRDLIGDVPIHIFFHETWIKKQSGLGCRAINHKSIRFLQREAVRRLVRTLKPNVIHTSNAYYRKELSGLLAGLGVGVIPVFSNITVMPVKDWARKRSELLAHFTGVGQAIRIHVFFGKLPPEWPLKDVLVALDDAAAQNGLTALFLSVGELRRGELLWRRCACAARWKGRLVALGGVSAEDVSHTLQVADCGIAVSPPHLLDKSGAVAAMGEHGLPVYVPLSPDQSTGEVGRDNEGNQQLIFFQPGWENRLAIATRFPFRERVGEVAEQFLAALKK